MRGTSPGVHGTGGEIKMIQLDGQQSADVEQKECYIEHVYNATV